MMYCICNCINSAVIMDLEILARGNVNEYAPCVRECWAWRMVARILKGYCFHLLTRRACLRNWPGASRLNVRTSVFNKIYNGIHDKSLIWFAIKGESGKSVKQITSTWYKSRENALHFIQSNDYTYEMKVIPFTGVNLFTPLKNHLAPTLFST